MNLSIPIIICHENEEIRLLLKDMLTKHGFFHLVEAHTAEELLQLAENDHFILVQKNLLSEGVRKNISHTKNYLIMAQSEDEATLGLSASFGVEHILSFPYSSQALIERITKILN